MAHIYLPRHINLTSTAHNHAIHWPRRYKFIFHVLHPSPMTHEFPFHNTYSLFTTHISLSRQTIASYCTSHSTSSPSPANNYLLCHTSTSYDRNSSFTSHMRLPRHKFASYGLPSTTHNPLRWHSRLLWQITVFHGTYLPPWDIFTFQINSCLLKYKFVSYHTNSPSTVHIYLLWYKLLAHNMPSITTIAFHGKHLSYMAHILLLRDIYAFHDTYSPSATKITSNDKYLPPTTQTCLSRDTWALK